MIFPPEPILICSKCGHLHYIPSDDIVWEKTGFRCFNCGFKKKPESQSFYKFVKFYRRLVTIDPSKIGIDLVGYRINKIMEIIVLLDDAEIECLTCHKRFKIPFERIKKIAREPAIFRCPKCRALPQSLKDLKEYFVCLRWVFDMTGHMIDVGAFFDCFSPIGISPGSYLRDLEIQINRPLE
jgi:DNA-directed RNA polymerase subunit RPC12/RpoP